MYNIMYAQILVLDNKIEAWKICKNKKNSPYDFKAYWKKDRFKDYSMNTKEFRLEHTNVPDGWDFNSYVYNILAPQWINKFEYAKDYHGAKAVIRTLDEIKKIYIVINSSLATKRA